MRKLTISIALLVFAALSLSAQDQPESWIESPEAYFATLEEKKEWATLTGEAEREEFKSRYWLKRDPSPGTPENEFRNTVLERMKVADARFTNNNVAGSRTDQGMVFIVFGTPARVGNVRQPGLPSASSGGGDEPPGGRGPLGWVEGNETTTTWVWDRDRTPRILDIVKMPTFDLVFITEPNKRTVKLQNPGKANDLREMVAEASIVNPELRQAEQLIPTGTPIPMAELSSSTAMSPATLDALRTAPQQNRHESGVSFGHAVILRDGEAAPVVWAWVPEAISADPTLRLRGLVSGSQGEVGRFDRPFEPSPHFVASQGGSVATAQLPLQAGEWNVALALERDGRTVATTTIPVKVPDVNAEWSASSLLLTGGPAPSAAADLFTLGGFHLPPRADSTFLTSESLWYFFQVSNLPAPENAWIEMRLRKDGRPFGKPVVRLAELGPVEPGIWMGGFEIPLSELSEGDYTLYLGLKEDPQAEEARTWLRGDFRVLAR